jgi:RNA polymerase sigma-70 factor (ECF subfamily)
MARSVHESALDETSRPTAHGEARESGSDPRAQRVAQDEATFRAILLQYNASMRRVARVYAGRDGDDEDLYQEMQFQVWRSLPSFRGEASLSTWVYRVALNTAIKHRRRARRRIHPTEDVDRASAKPAARAQEAILHDFLATLGAIDRSVLLLYMEGLSQQHIADVVGMNEGAVAVRIHRIKRAFQRRYTEE